MFDKKQNKLQLPLNKNEKRKSSFSAVRKKISEKYKGSLLPIESFKEMSDIEDSKS